MKVMHGHYSELEREVVTTYKTIVLAGDRTLKECAGDAIDRVAGLCIALEIVGRMRTSRNGS